MRSVRLRLIVTRYLAAWCFLAGVTAGGLVVALLPGQQGFALSLWASTNVTNLEHHPVAALIVSAFLPAGAPLAWLAIIPLAVFGAVRALGNVRAACVCATGHVLGTLVSEGFQAYQVDHGRLGPAARNIMDIGPSYVVVAAIAIAIMFGPWPARLAALLALAILIFPGHIFAGLSQLQVAPVGHVTSIVVAALAGGALAWLRRRSRQRQGIEPVGASGPAGPSQPLGASGPVRTTRLSLGAGRPQERLRSRQRSSRSAQPAPAPSQALPPDPR